MVIKSYARSKIIGSLAFLALLMTLPLKAQGKQGEQVIRINSDTSANVLQSQLSQQSIGIPKFLDCGELTEKQTRISKLKDLDEKSLFQKGWVLGEFNRHFKYTQFSTSNQRCKFADDYWIWLNSEFKLLSDKLGNLSCEFITVPYELRKEWALNWWKMNNDYFHAKYTDSINSETNTSDAIETWIQEALLDAHELNFRMRAIAKHQQFDKLTNKDLAELLIQSLPGMIKRPQPEDAARSAVLWNYQEERVLLGESPWIIPVVTPNKLQVKRNTNPFFSLF